MSRTIFIALNAFASVSFTKCLTNSGQCYRSFSDLGSTKSNDFSFEVIKNEVVFKGWRNIVKRKIKQPNGHISTFDIVSEGRPSVGVFIWDTKTSTTTLVREFHPGTAKIYYGVVGGVFESDKHVGYLNAAQFELEEEAQLKSSNWVHLLDTDTCNVSFDKYSDNLLYPFVAMDCVIVDKPRAPDVDEFIQVERNVTYKKLMKIIDCGEMNIFSCYMCFKALKKLDEIGVIVDKTK